MRGSAVFRTGVAPGGALAGPWVRDPLWTRARAVPSLDLRFADDKSLVNAVTGASLVTFTRASSGTFVGSDGVLQTAATNEPRFDHNPTTGESLGLLVEEARTNSIRNNTMVGAVAGTPGTSPTNWAVNGIGTLTQQIVGTGVVGGINYIDIRLSGTTSTSAVNLRFETNTGATGTNGQTFTYSCWFARIAGSASNITSITCNSNLYDAGGAYITSPGFTGFDSGTNPTSFIRRAGTLTIASATSAFIQPQIAITFNSGVAIDITLRIGLPQLEQGAFATSVIPTTGATVTRAADVASITGTAFSGWYRQDEGSMYVDGSTAAFTGTVGFVAINNAGNTNRLEIRQGRINPTVTGAGTSVTWTTLSSPTLIANTSYKQAVAFSSASHSNSIAGVLTNISSTAIPAIAATQLFFGIRDGQTAPTSGSSSTIKRLAFWPTRLSNEVSQRISQP